MEVIQPSHSIVTIAGESGFVLRFPALRPRVLRANMSRKLLVALAFENLLHFVYGGATQRTPRVERPGAFRASPTLTVRGFDPNQFPHGCSLDGAFSSCFRNSAAALIYSTETSAVDCSGILTVAVFWRRVVSATSMGTCAKCVSAFRIAAAAVSPRTLAAFKSYGENLLHFSAIT